MVIGPHGISLGSLAVPGQGLLHVVVANVPDWRRDGAYCPTAARCSFHGLIRI